MSYGFYIKIALTNIRKNARLYLPQILTGAGLTAMFYILVTLSLDERLRQVRGGRYLPTIMPLGTVVVAILSAILVLYTNSFLMKQRKREFGLYNVLGLEKRHVGRILFWESALSSLCAIFGGVFLGILLYKLCALLICRILQVDSVLGFYHVSLTSIVPTILFFLLVYLAAFILNRIQIARLNPVELLQSTHTGEKEPRIKWVLLLIGLLSLGTGYFLAVTTESPLLAVNLFFLAALLVILGTYCLFVTGSVALLKFLKSRKTFYYHPRHMISVSGLIYRMKQNAMGLASISILATMVLVMISTTVSMYAGVEETLIRQYPHDFYISAGYETETEAHKEIPLDDLSKIMHQAAKASNLEISAEFQQNYFSCAFNRKEGNVFGTSRTENISEIVECFFVTADEYQRLTGIKVELSKNQMAIFSADTGSKAFAAGDTLTVGEQTYTCTEKLSSFPINMTAYSLVNCYGIVVSDEDAFTEILDLQKEEYGNAASEANHHLVLDFSDEKGMAESYDQFVEDFGDGIREYVDAQPDSTGGYGTSVDSLWDTMDYLYGMYGTLLFLGLILTLVFLFATALIIYYKQISEGYEDRERFQIMQKVGMSSNEVRGTIRSQILLVFFLPLLVAALHMAVAFPMLTKLLKILFLSDQMLFFWCTVASLGVFAAIYVVIYGMTARVYYRIVK